MFVWGETTGDRCDRNPRLFGLELTVKLLLLLLLVRDIFVTEQVALVFLLVGIGDFKKFRWSCGLDHRLTTTGCATDMFAACAGLSEPLLQNGYHVLYNYKCFVTNRNITWLILTWGKFGDRSLFSGSEHADDTLVSDNRLGLTIVCCSRDSVGPLWL